LGNQRSSRVFGHISYSHVKPCSVDDCRSPINRRPRKGGVGTYVGDNGLTGGHKRPRKVCEFTISCGKVAQLVPCLAFVFSDRAAQRRSPPVMVMLRVIQTVVPEQNHVVRTGNPPQTRAGFSISDGDRVGLEGDKMAFGEAPFTIPESGWVALQISMPTD
jgi:hypothetical protein